MVRREIPASEILDIQKSIESVLNIFNYFKQMDGLDDYSVPIINTAQTAERILAVLLTEKGCATKDGMVTHDSEGNPVPIGSLPVFVRDNIGISIVHKVLASKPKCMNE